MNEELNRAYKEYQQEVNERRNEIITKLLTIRMHHEIEGLYKKWIDQVIDFIKEEN